MVNNLNVKIPLYYDKFSHTTRDILQLISMIVMLWKFVCIVKGWNEKLRQIRNGKQNNVTKIYCGQEKIELQDYVQD